MLKAEIISLVQDQTAHKADGRIDFGVYLDLRIQKFIQEKKHWWRRKFFTFFTVPGTPTYDLSSNKPDPNGNPLPGLHDVQQIRRMFRFQSATQTPEVVAIWDDLAMMKAQESAVLGAPTGYFIEPPTLFTVRLTPVPVAVEKIRAGYLSTYFPSSTVKDLGDVVPVYVHYAIVDGLKMDVLQFLYGDKDERYVIAKGDYDDAVSKSTVIQEFTSDRVDTFVSGSEAVTASATSSSTTGTSW